MRLLKPESSRCVYHRRVLLLPGSLSILQRLSCTSAASFHSFAAGLSLKKSVLQFHLTSNQFNSLLQWERRRGGDLKQQRRSCFARRSNVLLCFTEELNDFTQFKDLPLIHHFTPNPNMAQATLVHLTLPPSGTSICYLSGEAILQAILAIPPRSCSTADLISHLNLELIELAWHLSLIQKGHAVMPGTQVRGVRWN